jgi:DNA-binding beta-propeller fold protein YncE
MKKISTKVVSRFLGLRLGAPILAAAMLAAISLPSSSVYAAPIVSAVIPTPGLEPDGLAVSSDGSVLYVVADNPGTFDSNLVVINTQFNTITAVTPLFVFNTAVRSFDGIQVVENPAEQLVFILNFGNPSIDVINEATNAQIASFVSPNLGPNPTSFAVTPDGKELWVANSGPGQNNGTVQVVNSDPTSPLFGKAIALINTGGRPNTVVFNNTGTLAYVLNGGGPGWVDEIDVSTFDILKNNIALANGNINFARPLAMAISKDQKSLLIANGKSTLLQVDVPSGLVPNIAQMFTISNPGLKKQQQSQVLRSPGGATVYEAATGNRSVRFANTVSFLSSAPILLPAGSKPYFMALSPNGKTLYVSNFNNAVAGPFGGLESISVITGLSPL